MPLQNPKLLTSENQYKFKKIALKHRRIANPERKGTDLTGQRLTTNCTPSIQKKKNTVQF
jgi:hypothetical protein